MFNTGAAKERLTQGLSELYAHDAIHIEEYERILEYINKIETEKEAAVIEKIIYEHGNHEAPAVRAGAPREMNGQYVEPYTGGRGIAHSQPDASHLSVFSWRSTNVRPVNGDGGAFTSVFGVNRIIVDRLPQGRTFLHVHSVFGLSEIVVSKGIRITNRAIPVFGGVFMTPPDAGTDEDGDAGENAELPELYITGAAVFGNITIVRV